MTKIKKAYEPKQVDKLAFKVADLEEEIYALVCENEDLHKRVDSLELAVKELQWQPKTATGGFVGTSYTATFAPSEPWYKRVFAK
jgi:cell division septum initiation protein DivIVA